MQTKDNKFESSHHTIIEQVRAITAGESDLIANMANISAVLFNSLHDVNWAGFYIFKNNQLVLGPFQGNPACIRILLNKGVCGKAAATQTVQLIDDVHAFDGHIVCDAASRSELVVPIVKNNDLIGVLDIDSPKIARFTQQDADCLCKIVDILIDTME